MRKKAVTFMSLVFLIAGLIVIAASTILTSFTTRSQIWLDETVQIPAETNKTYSRSFPAGSILWVQYHVVDQDGGIGFAVMDETNYNKWRADQSATYIKRIEAATGAGTVFVPPFEKTLYFVFDNSFGEETTNKKVAIDVTRLWNEYNFLLPSEAAYGGFILLAVGFGGAIYGVVSKPKLLGGSPTKIHSENPARLVATVGLIVLLASAMLTWVNVYKVWWLNPEDGYVAFTLAYSSGLFAYLLNFPMTIESIRVIYAQGSPDIALSLAVAFVAYCLAFILGAVSLILSFRKKKGLFLGALSSGALSAVSGISWIYVIYAAKTKPVWGSAFLTADLGPYVAIIAGVIILFSCYLYGNYKSTAEQSENVSGIANA